jgi:hypothetical protein
MELGNTSLVSTLSMKKVVFALDCNHLAVTRER